MFGGKGIDFPFNSKNGFQIEKDETSQHISIKEEILNMKKKRAILVIFESMKKLNEFATSIMTDTK